MSYHTQKGFYPPDSLRTYKLEEKLLDHCRKNNPRKYFHAFSVPEILETPSAIFKGLGREEQGDGLCYCGIPSCRYHDHETTVPPYPGFTFLVFVSKNQVVFDWRWEKINAKIPAFPAPENYETRFETELWRHSRHISKPTKT